MTTITLPRATVEQALEVLKFCTPKPRPTDDDYAEQGWKEHNAAITALRAALAQQAEPAQEPVAICCNCLGTKRPHADDPEWKGRCDCEPPQLAEPAQEPVAWVASKDGRVIYDDASTDDGLLRVSGDFENDEQRVRYAQRIVDKLNAAPPQQTEPPNTMMTYREGYAAGVAAEREACAQVCDDLLANPRYGGGWSDATIEAAVVIRARGNT